MSLGYDYRCTLSGLKHNSNQIKDKTCSRQKANKKRNATANGCKFRLSFGKHKGVVLNGHLGHDLRCWDPNNKQITIAMNQQIN